MTRSLVGVLCVCVLLGGGAGPVSAAPAVPTFHERIPRLKLGLALKDFLTDYSADELKTAEKGIRRFTLNENSLPNGLASVTCEFSDGRLTYVEATTTPEIASTEPWSVFTAATIKKLGTPTTWLALANVDRSLHGLISDSAAWRDRRAILAFGRSTQGGRDVYVLVLATPARFGQVVGSIRTQVAQQSAQEAARVAELERSQREQQARQNQEAEMEAIDAEWRNASAAFWSALWAGSAVEIRMAADRVSRAARASRKAHLMPESQADEVERYVGLVKQTVNVKSATIRANAGWQETGLKVDSDKMVVVRIEPGQEWTVSSRWGTCGPAGYPKDRDKSSSYRVAPSFPSGALICDTGDKTPVTYMPGRGVIEVKTGTAVRCRINDTDVNNNTGAVAIEVVAMPAEQNPPLSPIGK